MLARPEFADLSCSWIANNVPASTGTPALAESRAGLLDRRLLAPLQSPADSYQAIFKPVLEGLS